MIIREINETEVYKLLTCIKRLSEHHNLVSVNFKGYYPSKPYEKYGFKVNSHILWCCDK